MQHIKQMFNDKASKLMQIFGKRKSSRIRVGILGTGKIGTDLLVKVQRSPWLECVIFSGRNLTSDGMLYAARLGVNVSDEGIKAFLKPEFACDIVFDATSAADHKIHAPIFKLLNVFAIDMTPSQIGECCVPALEKNDITRHQNVSMISCGGQSSIPIASVLAEIIPTIAAIEVRSVVSANSIGPGTLANINEYYQNTKAGLYKYTGVDNLSVDLQIDQVNLETKMYTSITVYTEFTDMLSLISPLNAMEKKVQTYVPGYQLESAPIQGEGFIRIDLSVEGLGDYLPTYAGNLDIINCAAIAVADEFARRKSTSRKAATEQSYYALAEEV